MAGASLGALVLLLTATPALADPSAPTARPIAMVGSDTTQDLGNALAETVVANGGKAVASWDARPPVGGTTRVTTKDTGCSFTRPNGSGAGRQALRAALGQDLGAGAGIFQGDNVVGCVDAARSSAYSGTVAGTTGSLTYIPAGVDAVAPAINRNSDFPRNNSFARIQRVFKCFDNNITGLPAQPVIPQAGSGTRQFWLQQMEITEQEITLGDVPCLTAVAFPQEHDGSVLTGNPNRIVPFSAAQFIAQTNSAAITAAIPSVTVQDRRGDAILTGMNRPGQPVQQPVVGGVLNPNYPLNRDVYHVVGTNRLAEPLIDQVFVGSDALVCNQTVNVGGNPRRVVELLGFGVRTTTTDLFHQTCGTTDLKANS
ncbi:hypothetical protein Vau01_017300 [Virgisporangium aurantiacum]|uniref:PBP domain-containing protein n=1 Tax=Virgisporangium aurantiacum TaxID=175570 RepID=A0A8J3YY87_9ACTN|nr:hypothetical protein Vau01_017300 [Virgisporangium aurantiacum]